LTTRAIVSHHSSFRSFPDAESEETVESQIEDEADKENPPPHAGGYQFGADGKQEMVGVMENLPAAHEESAGNARKRKRTAAEIQQDRALQLESTNEGRGKRTRARGATVGTK